MAELNAGQADATTRRATITGELATIAGRERRLLDALADGNGAAEAIRTDLPAAVIDDVAHTAWHGPLPEPQGTVCIVSAGTSDASVARDDGPTRTP